MIFITLHYNDMPGVNGIFTAILNPVTCIMSDYGYYNMFMDPVASFKFMEYLNSLQPGTDNMYT